MLCICSTNAHSPEYISSLTYLIHYIIFIEIPIILLGQGAGTLIYSQCLFVAFADI